MAQITTARAKTGYRAELERLSQASVTKHYRAYSSINWDAEEYRVDCTDPRWEIRDAEPLRDTPWYRSLPSALRAEIGLMRIATRMRRGVLFENILQRGLLEFSIGLPTGSVEYRYAMHELIEEGEHSLMFQEFIHRTGLRLPPLSALDRNLGTLIAQVGRVFPELFFIFVLGGEAPIDYDQRKSQAAPWERHPLIKKVEQIHITEEARHLRFAERYLREHVPNLSPSRLRILQILAPLTLAYMFHAMMGVPTDITRRFCAPEDQIRAAYRDNSVREQETRDAFESVRTLCRDLGILTEKTKWIWTRCRLETNE